MLFKSIAIKPLLTEAQMAKRVTFCKKNFNRDWKTIAFSDSKYFVFTFSNGTRAIKAWVSKDERPVSYLANVKEQVHAYAAITYHG